MRGGWPRREMTRGNVRVTEWCEKNRDCGGRIEPGYLYPADLAAGRIGQHGDFPVDLHGFLGFRGHDAKREPEGAAREALQIPSTARVDIVAHVNDGRRDPRQIPWPTV
jgi:hypothetical protein